MLETGYLSAEEHGQKRIWQAEIAQLKKNAGKAGLSDPSGEKAARIAEIENLIRDQAAEKSGLTDVASVLL